MEKEVWKKGEIQWGRQAKKVKRLVWPKENPATGTVKIVKK